LQEVSDQIKAAGPSAAGENELAGLLAAVTMRTQTFFDQRTHQRRAVAAAQFSWIHLAAKLAVSDSSRGDDELAERVEAHLLESLDMVSAEWGRRYWHQIAEQTLDELPEDLQTAIRETMPGAGTKLAPATVPIREWPEHLRPLAIEAIGHRVIRQAHRELMLGVIGQSWVEYLTQMEALRTSVGLEAYAQRDPLVQYKSSAFDLFQALMQEVRSGVVSRLFHMSLRTAQQNATAAAEDRPAGPELPASADSSSAPAASSKRKRHRH
jgi:preprotein translocase subunit SecA